MDSTRNSYCINITNTQITKNQLVTKTVTISKLQTLGLQKLQLVTETVTRSTLQKKKNTITNNTDSYRANYNMTNIINKVKNTINVNKHLYNNRRAGTSNPNRHYL